MFSLVNCLSTETWWTIVIAKDGGKFVAWCCKNWTEDENIGSSMSYSRSWTSSKADNYMMGVEYFKGNYS